MPLYDSVISPPVLKILFTFFLFYTVVFLQNLLYGERSSDVIFLVSSQESPVFPFFIVSLIGEKTTRAFDGKFLMNYPKMASPLLLFHALAAL